MEEIAKLVLSAPALNVALLCLIGALFLLYKRDQKKKNGNGNYAPLERFERLEAQVQELTKQVLPQVAEVRAELKGLARLLEFLLETHRNTEDNIKLLVDRLDK